MNAYSIGFTSQVYYKICDAERALGPLTRGQKRDLIIDNFSGVRDSAQAEWILGLIYGPAKEGK